MNSNEHDERQLCPLSFAQERLWFLDQFEPGSPAYNISQIWRLEGEFNSKAFEHAINEVLRRHEILRTTFSRIEGKPVEIISAFKPLQLSAVELAAEADARGSVRTLIDQLVRQPFDLQHGPLFRVHLFRVAAREHQVLFTLHHIISDAWSFEILRREITVVYNPDCDGVEAQLPELPIQYLDYAQWQREQVTGDRLLNEISFWRQQLSGELPRLELPWDKSPCANPTSDGSSEPLAISDELTLSLRNLAQREGATLFTVLLAAFNTFLHRITGQDDFIIGTPVSGRDLSETENLIGILINTIPLRSRIQGDPAFVELLRDVRDSTFSAFSHQEVPFDQIVNAMQLERAHGQNPLFQVVMALHGGYPDEWALGDLRATMIEATTHTAKFDLTLLLEEAGGGIKGCLEYKTDLFETGSIKRLLQRFQLLLQGIVAHPERRLSQLPLMNEAERQQLLTDWNQTTTPYERDACIHEIFESRVRETPQATALVFQGRQITYVELNERANQLAHRLRKSGVQPDAPVGLCLDRSPEMIIAMLAILKAGGAYVPLDANVPRERLAFMIRDTGVRLIITTGGDRPAGAIPSASDGRIGLPVMSALAHCGRAAERGAALRGAQSSTNFCATPDVAGELIEVIPVDQDSGLELESRENPRNTTTAESLAYILFTSGSTGTPKAVAIPHRAVVRLVRNTNYATFSSSDVFLQLAPASFDASTFEIWGALLNGAKLEIFPPHTPSLEELGRTLESSGVTTLWLTAGLFHQMVDHQLASLKAVRQLLAGGDVLSVPHVLKAIRELPGCQIINGYGPTENTTFTCCHRVPRDWSGARSVPVGKPVSNTRVYVLDPYQQPVPIGVIGELFTGGDGLARGYLNQPALNQEKFLRWNPARPGQDCSAVNEHPQSGESLYRTGDLVRWLPDGNLEFLGRKDDQVKIRGFRIEPAEVESVMVRHPDVQQAAVVGHSKAGQDRELFAWVTLANGAVFDEPKFRAFLSEALPDWMIPSRIFQSGGFPLTPNGKIDRRVLSELERHDSGCEAGVPPRDATEETLHQIWQQVLGRNSFGVHDNFFQLGGHSLLVTRMISRIARALQIELPVRAVFEAPTVAGLAARLRTGATGQCSGGIPPRQSGRTRARHLLARISDLSDAEVDSLLSRSK
jgi:amino acid adenylation domain-containing protein